MLEGVEVKLHSWELRNWKVGVIRYMSARLIFGGRNTDICISVREKQCLIIQVFCDTTSYGLINSYGCFGGACCFYLQLKPTLLGQYWGWRQQLVRNINGYLPVEWASYSRRIEYLHQHLISRKITFVRNWLSSHCLFHLIVIKR